MTTPDRIWASTYSGKSDMGYWHDVPLLLAGPGTEYTRTASIPNAATFAQAINLPKVKALVAALREIRDNPCMDPEGNSAIASAALADVGS